MQESEFVKTRLLDRDTCQLAVIDIQQPFLDELPKLDAQLLVNRVGWLMEVAAFLKVPITATAENIGSLGSVVPEICEKLPPESRVFDKLVFGLANQEDIYRAIEAINRRVIVLVGLQTDVCVSQSALSLIARGHDVVAVSDACQSPGTQAHEAGLARMAGAGVTLMSSKQLYFEWVRSVRLHQQVAKSIGQPPLGIVL